MKVVLLNNPYRNRLIVPDMAGGLGFEGGEEVLLPPLDLLFLAASLLKANYQVKVLDPQAEKLKEPEVLEWLKKEEPEVLIASLSLPCFYAEAEFCARLKAEGFPRVYARTFITIPELQKEFLLNSKADALLFGELENSLADFLTGKEIKGVAFLQNGEFIRREAEVIQDLDSLPFPARQLVSSHKYVYNLLGRQVTTLQSSRGCPFSCAFYCPYPLVQGKKWRAMSPERIMAELLQIKELGIEKVFFRDATFTVSKERIIRLCQLIRENKLDFSWWCESRANCLDRELLEKMAQAGCRGINLGVETGDEESLSERAKQGVNLKDLLSLAGWCREFKLKLHLLLMLGIPGENRRSLFMTYQLIKKMKPHSIGITFLTPYPGTPLAELAEKKGWIISRDWQLYNGHQPVMKTDQLSIEDLKTANYYLWRGFNFQQKKSWIFRLAELLNYFQFRLWSLGK